MRNLERKKCPELAQRLSSCSHSTQPTPKQAALYQIMKPKMGWAARQQDMRTSLCQPETPDPHLYGSRSSSQTLTVKWKPGLRDVEGRAAIAAPGPHTEPATGTHGLHPSHLPGSRGSCSQYLLFSCDAVTTAHHSKASAAPGRHRQHRLPPHTALRMPVFTGNSPSHIEAEAQVKYCVADPWKARTRWKPPGRH